jgi:hypothetical protein
MKRKGRRKRWTSYLSYKDVKVGDRKEYFFQYYSFGAVDYVLMGVAMIHFLMKAEEGSTRANSHGF